MIAKYNEEQTVARVKKTYSIVSQAWNKYQLDNNCMGKVANCFAENDVISNNNFYNKFIKYFNYVKIVPIYTSSLNANWLPDKAYHINGTEIAQHWAGVYKVSSSDSVFLTLTDGTILHIQIPDNKRLSGFIFMDTNGKKGPNRIGKDQFPIGIGASNNPLYDSKVHPFFNEDNASFNLAGLCNIRDNGTCDADVCTKTNCSPTAYILKHNKLPDIN